MFHIITCGCITEEIKHTGELRDQFINGWRNLISMLELNMTSSRTECIVASMLNARILNTYNLMKLKCICTIKDLYNITGFGASHGEVEPLTHEEAANSVWVNQSSLV